MEKMLDSFLNTKCHCGEEAEVRSDKCLKHQVINKFDLVWKSSGSNEIFVIVSDIMDIPFFEDGAGSAFCAKPIDFTDPKEWNQTFSGWIAWNTTKQNYEIISKNHHYVKIVNFGNSSFIPFDQATGQLRNILGLLKLGGGKIEDLLR